MPAKLNIAVFASGKGSNFQAIIDALQHGFIRNTTIVLAITNNSNAGALAIARTHHIPALHLTNGQYASDDAFNKALLQALDNHHVNFIVLAGYMKKIDPVIIRKYKNRVINIHPALLPAFGGKGMYGMRVHEAVIASKDAVSGATVHLVDEEYDRGRILLQQSVPVDPTDTPETLAAKVLEIEHRIYPEVIRRIAEGQIVLDEEQPAGAN